MPCLEQEQEKCPDITFRSKAFRLLDSGTCVLSAEALSPNPDFSFRDNDCIGGYDHRVCRFSFFPIQSNNTWYTISVSVVDCA